MAVAWFSIDGSTPVSPEVIPALRLAIPASPIVTWTDASAHLRLSSETDRTLVETYIAAATAHLDAKYGILGNVALGIQTWDYFLDAFPCGPIKIPLRPFVDVTSISYYDTAGALQLQDASSWVVDDKSIDGWIIPVGDWPATLESINVVAVRFRAGSTSVPAPIKSAILLLTGHLYEHREAVSATPLSEVPIAVDRLVAPYRRIYV